MARLMVLLGLLALSVLAPTASGRRLNVFPQLHHRRQQFSDGGASSWQQAEHVEAALHPRQSRPPRRTTPLDCFQVAQPVLVPESGAAPAGGYKLVTNEGMLDTGVIAAAVAPAAGASAAAPTAYSPCSVTLMTHAFAYSYGMPFVGDYAPPSCAFNRVVMNFTVVSAGVQYDRLALMYLGDTEVWRTSTAEPVQSPGIRWTYMKDMTEYLALWKSPQKVIFDLGNLVNENYTASFNTTLTATFFTSDVDVGAMPPADLVLPVSAQKGVSQGAASQFTLPADNATTTLTSFPRNARRAVFAVSANGQANEEFWWGNLLQSDRFTFNETAGEFVALSPWREVQVLLDGLLVGVQWPFPVIFTGGVVPSLHRPIVGVDAFDLREHEIDITPWLPLLCDGKAHTFEIRIAGLDDTKADPTAYVVDKVYESWYVTGKVFVWVDKDAPDSVTTGTPPVSSSPGNSPAGAVVSISRQVGQDAKGVNQTLDFVLGVKREISYSATVTTAGGKSETYAWRQSLSYTNKGTLKDYGMYQVNDFLIAGEDQTALGGGAPAYYTKYSYPLFANTTVQAWDNGNLTLWARVNQGLSLEVRGAAVFPTGLEAFKALPSTRDGNFFAGSLLETSRDGEASYFRYNSGRTSSGYGGTDQLFTFGGLSAQGVLGNSEAAALLYARNVSAVNDSVVYDRSDLASSRGAAGGATAVATLPAAEEMLPATPQAVDQPAAAAQAEAQGDVFAPSAGPQLGAQLGGVKSFMSLGRMGLADGSEKQAKQAVGGADGRTVGQTLLGRRRRWNWQ